MKMNEFNFTRDEKATFSLRSLYENYGYSRYKMSKFEEYDLYANNKDFLISDNIITFNDASGKLMALKPDVTLSIIKSNRELKNSIQKVYYNENVYRISKGNGSFKEIMQVGLEAIGEVDDYCISEVLTLAAKSLLSINENAVLDIAHLNIISEIIDSLDLSKSIEATILKLISEKNGHELKKVFKSTGIDNRIADQLNELISIHGNPRDVLSKLKNLLGESQAINELQSVLMSLDDELLEIINIDFSAVPSTGYYNGFVFKGYIEGIPESILSGGQYDRLLKKMKQDSKAIGFAVYLDLLENLEDSDDIYDLDAVVVYEEGCDLLALTCAVNNLIKSGKTVKAQKGMPQKIKYKQLLKFTGTGVEVLEDNA